MKVLTESERFSPEQLAKIEAHYSAKYVCETCIKTKSGAWANTSVSILYQDDLSKVPAGGSQWFGLFFKKESPDPDSPTRLFIVNALSAVDQDIEGIVAANGDVIYSRYRHDYRHSPDESVWIDGGRDYTRFGFHNVIDPEGGAFVTLRIVEDKLTVVEEA